MNLGIIIAISVVVGVIIGLCLAIYADCKNIRLPW
jgi:hypothetical protein